jgi:hypothetical protein
MLALAVATTAPSLAGSAPTAGPVPDRFPAVGVTRVEPPRPAPDVLVVVEGGERVPLRSLGGRPVMLWFFATW